MTNINYAPYLDSVGIKAVINAVDISQYVTDVEFSGETKLNDTTTFGYGVSAQAPNGGTRYSPSIDTSAFTLTMLYNQAASATSTISVSLKTGWNAYTYTGQLQAWSAMVASISTKYDAALYLDPTTGGWVELSGATVQPGWLLNIDANQDCTWTFSQVTSDGTQDVFLSIGNAGVPTGIWNNRGTIATGNTPVSFVIAPAGNVAGSGNTIITGNCYAPKFTLVGKVGNAITFKVEFKVDGGVIISAA